MIDPKDVTIIIPHLGASPEQEYSLEQCLKSLIETCPKDIKILVVCNGNSEICNHRLIVPFSMALLQQGQCKAVNAAVATTNTEWIFITNDDMVYPPNWFDYLTRHLEMEPNLYCASPKLVEPRPGAPTFLVEFCGGAGGDFNKEKFLQFDKKWHEGDNDIISNGFNFPVLIKRELWDTIGGYDINYDPWGSNGDSDLQAKVHLAGIIPVQVQECLVYHFGMTSGTSHPSNRPFWEKNWHYFIEKWGFERASSPDVWFSRNIIDYDKLKYKPDWMSKYGQA